MNIPLSLFDRFGNDRYALAFIELIKLSDNEGNVYHTERELEYITGWSKSFIHRVLVKAEKMGAIKVVKNGSEPKVNQGLAKANQERTKKHIINICGIECYKNGEPKVNQDLTKANQERTKKQEKKAPFSDGNLMGGKDIKIAEKYPFEQVWELYGKKNDKKVSMLRWKNLSDKDKKSCLDFIPAYTALTTKGGRRLLSTFLNKRTWENETIDAFWCSIDVKDFKADLLDYPNLFRDFVSHFNDMISGTKIPPVDLKNGLTEERRVMFNIAYCLSFDKTKLVMNKVLTSPRLNGTKGFVANYDFIFNPRNFQQIYEGVYDI
ncbi:hypothetical protein [Prevotella corporis]|uniref:hypothetical protein n=1 Tax=Prevotella corporis TaxID=28128 RepID=UPI0023F790CD|nr:hypothetical protein [Prevotella corporis]